MATGTAAALFSVTQLWESTTRLTPALAPPPNTFGYREVLELTRVPADPGNTFWIIPPTWGDEESDEDKWIQEV